MKTFETCKIITASKLVFFLFFSIVAPNALFGSENPRILVINSNASVGKYRVAHVEFKKTLPHQVRETDLGKKKGADIDELLRYDPDLVYCIGAKAYFFADKHFGKLNKPIVFSSIINWLRLPLSPKTFGVSNELHTRMPLMMFRYVLPDIKKIGVLYSRQYTGEWFEKSRDQARELKTEIIGKPVSDKKQTMPALKQLIPDTDAVWLISDPLVMPKKKYLFNILKTCDAAKKPVFSYYDAFAKIGAVLIVSADNPTIGRQAAGIALEIISGSKPDEKVQYPAGSSITLNLKKVEEYGLKYNKSFLGSINNIIK
ncbi:MAG: hypothetical protein GY795_19210 [Desulfobacterales bacterium]|nr:hypothetical protein [Desulfobacterales bacterium]